MYSMYFPDVRRVTAAAAAVVGCVCLDYLTCTECERILGNSFLPTDLAARKKQRTDPHVPVARVDDGAGQGLVPGSHGVEASDAAISGMADPLGPGSQPPLHGIEESDGAISGMADRPGRGSRPPSDGIEVSDASISSMADRPVQGSNGGVQGFEAGISGMAARLRLSAAVGERAKELLRKMGEARAWPRGPGSNKFRSGCPLAYAACLSIACRTNGSALSLRELAADGGVARKDIARLVEHIRRRLGEDEAGHGKSSTGTSMLCLSSYVRRFGALVGLGKAEATAALEAARRLEEGVLVLGHNVDSVAAAVVCMALERADAVRSGVKDVAAATGITNLTIYAVCRKLRAHDLLFG
ncbi:unnamed protein product [Alopecurus aequalis]